MAVFWLGTVPALNLFAGIVNSLSFAVKKKLPIISAASIIALGVLTLSGKFNHSHQHDTENHSQIESN